MGAYQLLFRVEVVHAYFLDPTRCRLSFEPDAAASAWLKRAGCVSRPAPNGLAVYCEHPEALDDVPVTLSYRVSPQDAAFGLYSEGLAVADGAGPGSMSPLVFDSARARLLDGPRNQWRLTATPGVATGGLNLRPDFVVRIGLTGGPSLNGRSYRIAFDSRAAVWKYLLIGDWTVERPCVVVNGKTGPDLFADPFADPKARPREELLADGRTAVAVRSKAPIALSDRPTQKLQLWSRHDDGALADRLVSSLPNAAPANFAIETPGDPSTLVAEIFVSR